MSTVVEHVRENRTIKLPPFDPANSSPSPNYALLSVGLEANPFRGTVAGFRYQLEGEEDLLHLIVTDLDGQPITPEQGQSVAGFVLNGLPTAMIWMRPGHFSQHFYFGHDELLNHLAH